MNKCRMRRGGKRIFLALFPTNTLKSERKKFKSKKVFFIGHPLALPDHQ